MNLSEEAPEQGKVRVEPWEGFRESLPFTQAHWERAKLDIKGFSWDFLSELQHQVRAQQSPECLREPQTPGLNPAGSCCFLTELCLKSAGLLENQSKITETPKPDNA